MNVVTVDPREDRRWLTFIHGHPDATVFHHPAWLSLLAAAYGYKLMVQLAVEGEEILGGLPILEIRSLLTGPRAVALPFCDFCPPLVSSSEALDHLVRSLAGLRAERRWKYVEIRHTISHPELRPAREYRAHVLLLGGDPDAVFSQFKKTQVQQSIRRAEREGVGVERRTDDAAVSEFIRLNALTRRRHGIPPQPDHFFRRMREMILEPGHGFVSLASHNGRVIASAVYLHFGQTVIYKYGASAEGSLWLRPNHAVMWDAIRWSCEEGYSRFHFGRTDPANEGLLRFKRGWGTEESVLGYVRIGGGAPRKLSEGGMASRIKPLVNRTPMPILRALGRALYRHLG